MRRLRALAIAAVFTTVTTPALPEVALPDVFQLFGSVTNSARPVGNALVIALNLNSFNAVQTYTGADGSFSLASIPAGVYKIIAVKQGFIPAIATLVPTRPDHRVNLKMQTEKQAKGKSMNQEIWEIRGSLPPDVLREVDQVLARPVEIASASYDVPRLKGEMLSMTALSPQPTAPAFAQTQLGVQSRLGDSWQIGIHGDMQRFDDPTDNGPSSPLAEASTMEMEVRSSPTDSYRLASTRSSWKYADLDPNSGARDAALTSHNFEWQHGDARVKVQYFAHDNLIRESRFGSDAIEIAGDTNIIQTQRNDVNVSLRVRQESLRSANVDPMRTADVVANATTELVPSLLVHYGMASRLGIDRTEWAPRTGLEWKLTKNTSLIGSAAYKVLNETPASGLFPTLVSWTDEWTVLPRYSYSVGFVSSRDDNNKISAVATVSAADAPMQVVFSDGYQQFWDGLYVEAGDVRRDLRVAYRRDFGNRFAIDVATTAGTAHQKVYVTGDLQTIFTPTRTTLAVTYREIEQPQANRASYHSSRVNMRMAQSLYLPIDVKVLLGIELGRAVNSPFLLDTLLQDETSRKYIGGLAVNF